MEDILDDHGDRLNQHENIYKNIHARKRGIPFVFDWKSVETETTAWSEFCNVGKAIVEQILASEERNKRYFSSTETA